MLHHVASDFFVELSKVTGQNNRKSFLADEMSSKTLAFALKKV
jgi:stress-induced morphogen